MEMEVTNSSKYGAEVKVGKATQEVTLYFRLTEKGIWLTAKSSYGPRYIEKEKFNIALDLATEAVASHWFAPIDKKTMVELVLSSMHHHKHVDVAVEAIFLSKKIPPYDFLKSYIGWEVKKVLGAKSKKRAEKRAEERRRQGQIQTKAEEKRDRQLLLLL